MTVSKVSTQVLEKQRAARALIEMLLGLESARDTLDFLEQNYARVDADELAVGLKEQADQLLRSDIQRSLDVCALLLHLSDLTGRPDHHALGLLAEANARNLGLGAYEQAIRLYDEAAALYRDHGQPVEQAGAQAGKIGALTFLGRYNEALQTGPGRRRCWNRRIAGRRLRG